VTSTQTRQRRLPPLNALKAFEATARHLSMSGAAGELGVTHSAVSHHVRHLEETLGVPLFERVSSGVRLTADGARLSRALSLAFDSIADTVRHMDDTGGPDELLISCPHGFAAKWLAPELGSFLADNPKAQISMVPTNVAEESLRPDYDLSIIYGEIASETKRVVRLTETLFFPVCSPSFLNAHRGTIREPQDLLAFTLLHAEDTRDWTRWFARAGVDDIRGVQNVDMAHAHFALDAAAAGHGIALADNFVTNRDLRDGRLVRIFDITIPAPHVHHLVTPHDEQRSALSRRFEAWVMSKIGER